MLITQMRVLQDLFRTIPLTGEPVGALPGAGVVLLMLGEIFKVILRARRPHEEPAVAAAAAPAAA